MTCREWYRGHFIKIIGRRENKKKILCPLWLKNIPVLTNRLLVSLIYTLLRKNWQQCQYICNNFLIIMKSKYDVQYKIVAIKFLLFLWWPHLLHLKAFLSRSLMLLVCVVNGFLSVHVKYTCVHVRVCVQVSSNAALMTRMWWLLAF